tara:strand:- start:12318 stop:14312 length:1995 start_codon:yes stop_codon:yes gene_type:complete
MKDFNPSILILSDSTSSTVGLERKIHHMVIADKKIWPKDTTILNFSIPGTTSADALAYLRLLKSKTKKSLKAIFIYLGNCDTISTENPKGYYSYYNHIKHIIKRNVNSGFTKKRIKNKILFYQWNKKVDLAIEQPETPENFEKNLSKICCLAEKFGIEIIMVRSEANKFFIPGLGKGNFIFYKFLGINDKISESIEFPDERLKKALFFHENQNYNKTLELYKDILDNPLEENFGSEFNLMILNNYAVAKAEFGYLDEAKHLLRIYLHERFARKEIGYFNLAQIEKIVGNQSTYEDLIFRSYENDKFLYRIRKPYQNILDGISKKFKNIIYLDMKSAISRTDYLDHCHPLPEGQKKLAKLIEEAYSKIGLTGNEKATIVNDLYNPELANGNQSPFNFYFKSISDIDGSKIRELFKKYFNLVEKEIVADYDLKINNIPNEIQNACQYYLKHPLFTNFDDIKEIQQFETSDIGRFPENFIYRFIIPILKEIEIRQPQLLEKFNKSQILVHSSDSFKRILKEQTGVNFDLLKNIRCKNFGLDRVKRIIAKIKTLILEDLNRGNQIYTRLKTTMYWYFRESLRFGSHSRNSMLYNRVLYEYVCEALIISFFYNKENKYGLENDLTNLYNKVLKIIYTHDFYCKKFKIYDNTEKLLADYNSKIKDLIKKF